MKALRSTLDFLYTLAGVLAAISLVVILVLIVIQMLARWTGEVSPGIPEYAGYFMAASSFLAFAYALNKGAHIRVSILLNAVGAGVRRVLEIWCFAIGAIAMWYFTWHAWEFVAWSWELGEVSQGQDATMLWIPQSTMVIGGGLLAIALTDHLLHLIFTGHHRIVRDVVDAQSE